MRRQASIVISDRRPIFAHESSSMTKERLPVSIENALFTVLGTISLARAAEVTGRSVGYLAALSDPDKRERLSIDDALKLDIEHQAKSGRGYPIFEAYRLMIETAGSERFADHLAIQRHSVTLVKETGEACAAVVAAGLPTAGRRERLEAARQVEEAVVELRQALPLLVRDAGASGGGQE